MASSMVATLDQFRVRLGVPSATCTTDSLTGQSTHDSSLRTSSSRNLAKNPLRLQLGSNLSRRRMHSRSGFCAAASSSTVEPLTMYSTAGSKPTTLYNVLGISDMVSDEEVKAAFRRIAKQVHPDQAPPDKVKEYQRKFMEAHKAYSVLKDPRTRSLYNYEIRNSVYASYAKARDWKRPMRRGCNWETDQCWTS